MEDELRKRETYVNARPSSSMPTTVCVITSTTGNSHLRECILSVQAQTVPVQHLIVVDGPRFHSAVDKILGKIKVCGNAGYTQKILVLPTNTGGNGYLCHRIYGAAPFLVNAEYVAFLDEDNAFEPDHIEDLLESMRTTQTKWTHGLRKIVDANGHVVCKDLCESLGSINHTCINPDDRLIDTNCYLIRRDLAIQASPLWNTKARQSDEMDADRKVANVLLRSEPCGVSRNHSVKYRAGNGTGGVDVNFFLRGNAVLGKGVGGYDFENKSDIYLFHFNAAQTAWYVHGDHIKSPLDEWCPTMWLSLHAEYNLLDGFANVKFLPRGAKCLIAMCHPDMLPMDIFKARKDLRRIVYTAESPNIRHQPQWDRTFLADHFDHVMTFWDPLLRQTDISTSFAPHNSRFLKFPDHDDVLRENEGPGTGSVVIVLENRHNSGTYIINDVELKSLDWLRETFVRGLRDVTACGSGWAGVPGVKLGNDGGNRATDPLTAIDYYQRHDFALIIENCDALGYVSEKFGDAMIAGTVPLYYGNPGSRVHLPTNSFIDITGCASGHDIQKHIDDADIASLKRRVLEIRREFLSQRGADAMADAVVSVM
jgi:glycosyltransferase involved in cell wall biosynthesis